MTRVLMTADTVGGVWTYALELARALGPHGVEVCLATMGAPVSAGQAREASGVDNVTLFPSGYALEWMPDPWDDVRRAGDWLLALEERLRPDLIHLNGFVHGALPWRAPALVVGHSCVLSWWQAVKGEAAPPGMWERYHEEVAAGLQAAALVAAPTQAMLDALSTHYGPFGGPGRVLANGRDPALFRLGVKEPLILSAGRLWDDAKNVGALAEAARGLPWPVCVAGDSRPPDGSPASDPPVPPDWTDTFRLLGSLPPPTLAGWLSRASIYALPARYEPFGLSALEAALSGCALVLGDIPSLREVWGDAAVFVPPDDPAALHRALRDLIADDARRTRLATYARSRAYLFTPERMAAGYLAAYAKVQEEARSSARVSEVTR